MHMYNISYMQPHTATYDHMKYHKIYKIRTQSYTIHLQGYISMYIDFTNAKFVAVCKIANYIQLCSHAYHNEATTGCG